MTGVDGVKPEIETILEEKIKELREQAEVSQGKCAICAKEGKLLSGVCEECFTDWAAEAARAQMRWRKQ